MSFLTGDPPPFYDWEAPEDNTVLGTKPKARKKKRVSGDGDGAATQERDAGDGGHGRGGVGSGAREMVDVTTEGYIGKSKGIKQVLWERGLWVEGVTANEKDPSKNCETALGGLPDFQNERTALQHVVESRGHILVLSPKCHPEVAGLGIEYSWGMSKLKFRLEIKDEKPANLSRNIRQSMNTVTVLFLGRVRRFARRTRD